MPRKRFHRRLVQGINGYCTRPIHGTEQTLMAVTVNLPALFASIVEKPTVEARGANVLEVVENLVRRYPLLQGPILDRDGIPHTHIRVFLNAEDVRTREGWKTDVKDGDELTLLVSVAGG